jgi:hypothetical protein
MLVPAAAVKAAKNPAVVAKMMVGAAKKGQIASRIQDAACRVPALCYTHNKVDVR